MLNSTMTMFNYIPTILTIMLIPVFTKRFGKIKALFVGFLFYAAGLVLEIAGPVNLPMIYTGLVLQESDMRHCIHACSQLSEMS